MTAPSIMGVVVLYRPPPEVGPRLQKLVDGGLPIIAVFNECDAVRLQQLRDECSAQFVTFSKNMGLSFAFNAGVAEARTQGATQVLLLDQDSEPAPSMASALASVLSKAEATGLQVAAVGPTPIDIKNSDSLRSHASGGNDVICEWIGVRTIISSGSLIPVTAIERVGPLWDELFIDDIDHEWCLRARHLGYEILQARNITMKHDLGDSAVRLFGRFRGVHRSPFRHYHVLRNTLTMLRISQISRRWRLSEAAKTMYRVPVYLLISHDRKASFQAMLRALRDHRSLLGKLPEAWTQ